MKIVCMFGQRKGMPFAEEFEVMLSWSDFDVEANYEGFLLACSEARGSWGNDLLQWRIIEVEVDGSKIRRLFRALIIGGEVIIPNPKDPSP